MKSVSREQTLSCIAKSPTTLADIREFLNEAEFAGMPDTTPVQVYEGERIRFVARHRLETSPEGTGTVVID